MPTNLDITKNKLALMPTDLEIITINAYNSLEIITSNAYKPRNN